MELNRYKKCTSISRVWRSTYSHGRYWTVVCIHGKLFGPQEPETLINSLLLMIPHSLLLTIPRPRRSNNAPLTVSFWINTRPATLSVDSLSMLFFCIITTSLTKIKYIQCKGSDDLPLLIDISFYISSC